MSGENRDLLERLYETIVSRKGGDPAVSHTAKLFAKGRAKIAQKMGEEAVELAIAAVAETRQEVVSESADLVFHLLVLWADCGVTIEDIRAELRRREGMSGIEEKKARQLT
jgi:phosphoribosyl-ATP pyrophosphohydrolase